MAPSPKSNGRSRSTTTQKVGGTIRVDARKGQGKRPDEVRPSALPPRPKREPLHLTVVYRGGNSLWVEVHGRGAVIRRPGMLAFYDIVREFWEGWEHPPVV